MNTYEITFQRENGTTGSDRFTAATEAQARRDFNEVYRHGNGHITKVELIGSDSPATKEQERKALEKIKKIVEELGESSYIGMAFEGCFEIAEENIENDFACSMKQRAESAEQAMHTAHDKVAEMTIELKEAQDTVSRLNEEVATLRELTLSVNDLETFLALSLERKTSLDEEAANAATRIVENAGEPESVLFQNAVSDHRSAKRAADTYSAMAQRIIKALGK